jgi:hypothetical protein
MGNPDNRKYEDYDSNNTTNNGSNRGATKTDSASEPITIDNIRDIIHYELISINKQLNKMDESFSKLRKDMSSLEDEMRILKNETGRNRNYRSLPSIFERPQSRQNSISKPDLDIYPISSYKK